MKGSVIILLMVLLIIGIIYFSKSSSDKTNIENSLDRIDAAARVSLNMTFTRLKSEITRYAADFEEWPSSLQLLVPRYVKNSMGLADPWGKQILLKIRDNGFVLISAGADGKFNTSDDIERSFQ